MSPGFRLALGARVAALRIERGLTQTGLSPHIGRSRVGLSYIETGQVSPSLETLIALARFFDVTTDYLLFGG